MKIVKTLYVVALCTSIVSAALERRASAADPPQLSRDQVLAVVQEICPVSGRKLGTHGTPIKVKIGAEEMFLCCKGCTSGKVAATHWATIHANFAKAQGICPVMKNKLPKSPKWTVVGGQIVYVCCPPCIKKIQADANTHLQMVESLYRASLTNKGGS